MSSRLMRAGMPPKGPIRKGEKERKKRKIEVGQGKPLKPKKHEFCKRWLFVELMLENHRVPALIGL
jgi:hypothetical protein